MAPTVLSNPHTEETTTATETLTSPPSSSSAIPEDLPTLPFDIIVEILSRLPVKFLMQLQSVCKPWKSLISDPKFVKNHLRVSPTRHRLILTDVDVNHGYEFGITDYSLSSVFTEITSGVATITAAVTTQLDYRLSGIDRCDWIMSSCHGILCFAKERSRYPLLWNPSIRKFTKLPSLGKPKLNDGRPILYDCHPVYGFGCVYDDFNENYSYKVVAVNRCGTRYHPQPDDQNQVRVHTLGTNCWRWIEDFPSGFWYRSGRFLSGTLNWLGVRTDTSCRLWVIVSLDLEKESYQELVQPEYGVVTDIVLILGVVRDCLCILAQSDTFADFWLMNEYGNKESWTKLFTIPIIGCCFYGQVLYLFDDDQVLLKHLHDLVVYNFRDGTIKILEFQTINSLCFAEVYQESLVSPCSQ